MSANELELEIKNMIIDILDLEDISAEDIISTEPLFNEGLRLDSIHALELGVALHKRYGIKLVAESEESKRYFESVAALSELVHTHRTDRGLI